MDASPSLGDGQPFRPELVGRPPAEIVMGKGSGIDSVKYWLTRFQIVATNDQAMEILQAVKAFGLKHKRLLSDDDFVALAKDVMGG